MKPDTLRMIIGFALIVVILIGWQILFKPKPRPQPAPVAAAPAPPETAAAAEPKPAATPVLAPVKPASEAAPESTVVLENDVLRLELSSYGGTVKSAELKRFAADVVPPGEPLFGTTVLRADDALDISSTPMQVTGDDTSVTFTLKVDSLTVRKTYSIGKDYAVGYNVNISGPHTGFAVDAMPGVGLTEKNAKGALAHYHFYCRANKKLAQLQSAKLKKPHCNSGPNDWVGLKSKYFLLAIIPADRPLDSTYTVALDDGRIGFSATVMQPAPPARFTLYLGPIEYDRLRAYGIGLENVVGLGIAKPVGLAMLWLLRLLYRIFANWGVAIIIFSILMKAAFFPLTRTQTRQMRQMQLLQPKLNELKTKYKGDAQRLNQETMQLYRLYRINPMSGCLPLVVQLPIFWALYAVLSNSIELRGAGLGLWIHDLAEPDALFGHLPAGLPMIGGSAVGLLPVMMGVSFIAQNLLTSTDKRNWALTIIFPIFITLIFLNMPSGLQLYWFMYNILSILESVIGLKGGSLWRKTKDRNEPSPKTV